jgi:hypothetical protein
MNILNGVHSAALALSFAVPLIGSSLKAQSPQASAVENVVLVHGAWVDGSSWSKVIPLLEAKGLHVVSVQIPLTSLADDVAATKRALALIDGTRTTKYTVYSVGRAQIGYCALLWA